MAGAGKKTFIAGEVLTAAQVNDYLMDQAVMRFSGSAARAASITAPTEGMVTYLDDQNRIEIYSGSAWVPYPSVWSTASIGADGTVLTADSTKATGVDWRAPSGAKAALVNVTASATSTALSASLPAGYYSMQTNSSLSYNSSEFRFVGYDGRFYGIDLVSGAGTFTIPVSVASVNITKGAPLTGLVQEIPGITAILPAAPVITNGAWTGAYTGSVSASSAPGSSSVGVYALNGSLATMPASGGSASLTPLDGGTYLSSSAFTFVQRNAFGVYGVGVNASIGLYPYYVYRANGTYVPPPGSASAEVLVVAGGGGGGGRAYNNYASFLGGGGGGAGGVRTVTVATPGSVSVTVGSGGAGGYTGTAGGNTLFGSTSASAAGGGGGGQNSGAGTPGGSGGGGGHPAGAAGNGISGQGNNGAAASPAAAPPPRGGGGGGKGGAGSASVGGANYTKFGLILAEGGGAAIDSPATDNFGTIAPETHWGSGGNGYVRKAPFSGNAGGTGRNGIVIVRPIV